MAKNSLPRRTRTNSSPSTWPDIMLPSGRSRIGNPALKSGLFVSGVSVMTYLPNCSIQLKVLPVLFLPCSGVRFYTGLLVPPVETREVTRIPRLAESRSTQIPVWADFTRNGAQVVPKIDDGR